jgi:hypothetical protein
LRARTDPLPGVGIVPAKEQANNRKVEYSRYMHEHAIDISTEVFRLLQQRAPGYVAWTEEKPGPTQKILLRDDVYTEFIDRAIAHHQTLDQVLREACTKTQGPALAGSGLDRHTKRVSGMN